MAGTKRQIAPEWKLDYTPRPQTVPFHKRTQRWAYLVCHRRFGKTVACVHELLIRALYTSKKNAQYSYIAPFRQQAKSIAWKYLKDAVQGIAVEVRESDLMVLLPNGASIVLLGSDNPDAIRGQYMDGVVLDEFADCRPSLWTEVVLPTLADRKGWAVIIGTPKGRGNKFYDFYELSKRSDDWFHLDVKASQSGVLDEKELDEMREQMSDAQYEQEFENSFTAALLGTYYSQLINKLERDGHMDDKKAQYDPNFDVFCAADIGYSDSTVFWFWQERPDGLAIIDLYANHSQPLQHYADMLHSKPYQYNTIYLPHDARAKTLQTGKSTVEQLQEHGFPLEIAPHLSVQDGIEATRVTLPQCYFHATNCYDGIEALRTYRRKYDEINQTFLNKPLHDWASDYSDGFRYLALAADVTRRKKPPAQHHSLQSIEAKGYYTLDQLHLDREDNPNSIGSMRI